MTNHALHVQMRTVVPRSIGAHAPTIASAHDGLPNCKSCGMEGMEGMENERERERERETETERDRDRDRER